MVPSADPYCLRYGKRILTKHAELLVACGSMNLTKRTIVAVFMDLHCYRTFRCTRKYFFVYQEI